MSVAPKVLKAVNAFFWLLLVAIVAAMIALSLGAIAAGIEQNRLSFVLIGVGMSFMAVNYYYWRHPIMSWRPGFHTVLGAIGLVLFLLAAFLERDAL